MDARHYKLKKNENEDDTGLLLVCDCALIQLIHILNTITIFYRYV